MVNQTMKIPAMVHHALVVIVDAPKDAIKTIVDHVVQETANRVANQLRVKR